MIKETTFYVYNENGLINSAELINFCNIFQLNSMFDFMKKIKPMIDETSPIFLILSDNNTEFIVYDYGYIFKIEGNILKSIIILFLLDNIIPKEINFYVNPNGRIENLEEYVFPRGAKLNKIGVFLDKIFNTKDYSDSLLKAEIT